MRIEIGTHGLRLSQRFLERLKQHIESVLKPWSLQAISAQLSLTRTNSVPDNDRRARLVVRLPKVREVVVTDRHVRLVPLVKRLGCSVFMAINRRLERRRRLRRRVTPKQKLSVVA